MFFLLLFVCVCFYLFCCCLSTDKKFRPKSTLPVPSQDLWTNKNAQDVWTKLIKELKDVREKIF